MQANYELHKNIGDQNEETLKTSTTFTCHFLQIVHGLFFIMSCNFCELFTRDTVCNNESVGSISFVILYISLNDTHICKKSFLSPEARSMSFGFPPRSETNKNVQAQTMAILSFESSYFCSAHQLRGNRACFRIVCKNSCCFFLRKRVNYQ